LGVVGDRAGEDVDVGEYHHLAVPSLEHRVSGGDVQYGTGVIRHFCGVTDIERLSDQQ
jgi:hypothetical protein